jgi:tetratricopeptide (TPR) repeat protein
MNDARALSALGKHDKAAFELGSALVCDAPQKEIAEAHALLAAESLALHNPSEARAHRAEALKLDADNADAKALVVP